jgi:hypothetical protein
MRQKGGRTDAAWWQLVSVGCCPRAQNEWYSREERSYERKKAVRVGRTVIGTRMSFRLVLQLLVVEHEAVKRARDKKKRKRKEHQHWQDHVRTGAPTRKSFRSERGSKGTLTPD